MHRIIGCTTLYFSRTPSWAEHSAGCYANVEILSTGYSWGTSTQKEIVLSDEYRYIRDSVNPIAFKQLGNSSKAMFYMRGGAKYCIFTDFNTSYTAYTSSVTFSSQTVEPTTTAPSTIGERNITSANFSLSGTTLTITT